MRVPLYIIRFVMLNRETLYRVARGNRGRRARSICDGVALPLKSGMRPFTGK